MASQSGRVVLLTGAAGGIGRAITDVLLAAGHSVAAVDRDHAALDRLTARHAAAKDRLHPIVADLGTERAAKVPWPPLVPSLALSKPSSTMPASACRASGPTPRRALPASRN